MPKREEKTGGWRKLHNKDLYNLTYRQIFLERLISGNELGGTCGVCGQLKGKVYMISTGKPEHVEDLGVYGVGGNNNNIEF